MATRVVTRGCCSFHQYNSQDYFNRSGYSRPPPNNLPPLLPTPSFVYGGLCQICNKSNHMAWVCSKRGNFAYSATSLTDPPSSMSIIDTTDSWWIDSRASQHLTPQVQCLSQPQSYSGTGTILVRNGSTLPISHIGSSTIQHSIGSIPLHNVLCVPSLTRNLISIQKFSPDNRCFSLLDDSGFRAKDK